jgi:NADPH-dependent 2,4-dienoyl-CoA reductase/sulfur reductase-like enzyme
VEAFLGKCIAQVDPVKNRLQLTEGGEFFFEKLMIATGAHAQTQEIPGNLLKNVFTLHNRQDAKDIGAVAAP